MLFFIASSTLVLIHHPFPFFFQFQRWSVMTNGHSQPVLHLSSLWQSDDWKKGSPGLCPTIGWSIQVLNLAVSICCMQHCTKRRYPFVSHLLELSCWRLVWSAETGLCPCQWLLSYELPLRSNPYSIILFSNSSLYLIYLRTITV